VSERERNVDVYYAVLTVHVGLLIHGKSKVGSLVIA
jgi:hypothetical protein